MSRKLDIRDEVKTSSGAGKQNTCCAVVQLPYQAGRALQRACEIRRAGHSDKGAIRNTNAEQHVFSTLLGITILVSVGKFLGKEERERKASVEWKRMARRRKLV